MEPPEEQAFAAALTKNYSIHTLLPSISNEIDGIVERNNQIKRPLIKYFKKVIQNEDPYSDLPAPRNTYPTTITFTLPEDEGEQYATNRNCLFRAVEQYKKANLHHRIQLKLNATDVVLRFTESTAPEQAAAGPSPKSLRRH